MTPTELITLAIDRHGPDHWKSGMATDTGWSWQTFNRIEKGGNVSPKLARDVRKLPSKPKPRKEPR